MVKRSVVMIKLQGTAWILQEPVYVKRKLLYNYTCIVVPILCSGREQIGGTRFGRRRACSLAEQGIYL